MCQAVDAGLADYAAEELRRSSTSDFVQSQGSEPYFPFRPLEKVSAVENVVSAWMNVWRLLCCDGSSY